MQDIDDALAYIRKNHAGKKVFILGHSVGACYTLWYAANHTDGVDGMILAAPAIESEEKYPLSFYLRILLALLFARKTMFDLSRTWPEDYKKSEEFRVLKEDSLTTSRLSARYMAGLRPLVGRALANASRTREPTLIIQGEADDEVLPSGAGTLLENLGATDKSLQTFADGDHYFYYSIFPSTTSQDDPAKRQHVAVVICNWLKSR